MIKESAVHRKAKQGIWMDNVQNTKIPVAFRERFLRQDEGEGCGVCGQLMDILLTGGW